jgi:hypothetical protein
VLPFFFCNVLILEEIKAGKRLNMGGEGWRKWGNDPARWPPSEQGSWNRRRKMGCKTDMKLGRLQPYTKRPLWGASQWEPKVTAGNSAM